MKIVQLDIQGFRSLKNVSWRPGDLNVVIGPNGSGKSNLLWMLELISAGAQARLRDYIQISGGIGNVAWDGQDKNVRFMLTIAGTGYGALPEGFLYRVDLERSSLQGDYIIQPEVLEDVRDGFKVIESDGKSARIQRREGEVVVTGSFASPFVRESIFSSLGGTTFVPWIAQMGLPNERQRIQSWIVYQDIRTDQSASIRQAPVSRLEQQVSQDGQNLINVLHTLYTSDRKFKQDIKDAMYAAFGDAFDELTFGPAGDQRIQMRLRWKTLSRDQSTADLSDGTLRFLFLLTVLAAPNPPPLVAIDEPETGLHPSMLPIIAEYAAEAATRTQVIFTTHSDQFLSAFRETRPTVTVAKWENGETTLTMLDDSELEYWLQDYSLGNLFRSGELENMAA